MFQENMGVQIKLKCSVRMSIFWWAMNLRRPLPELFTSCRGCKGLDLLAIPTAARALCKVMVSRITPERDWQWFSRSSQAVLSEGNTSWKLVRIVAQRSLAGLSSWTARFLAPRAGRCQHRKPGRRRGAPRTDSVGRTREFCEYVSLQARSHGQVELWILFGSQYLPYEE